MRPVLAVLAAAACAAAFAAPAQAVTRTSLVCMPGLGGTDSQFIYLRSGKVHAYASWYPAWSAGCPVREVRIKLSRYRWYGSQKLKEPYFPFFPLSGEAVYDCAGGDTYTYFMNVTFVYTDGVTYFDDGPSKRVTC